MLDTNILQIKYRTLW